MKNKKFGFTLAEVLIALAIIGVVAALTLPSFTANTRYQSMAAKLSATITSIESGLTTMLASEGAENMEDTRFYRALPSQSNNTGYNPATGELAKYLKLEIATQPNVTYQTLSGDNASVHPSVTYLLKNGSYIMYQDASAGITEATAAAAGGSVTTFIARVDIDVNGAEKPNKYGRDIFRFGLGDNGHLYAYGSKSYSLVTTGGSPNGNANPNSLYWRTTNDQRFQCSSTHKDVGCTARLIDENYKINF